MKKKLKLRVQLNKHWLWSDIQRRQCVGGIMSGFESDGNARERRSRSFL